MMFSHPNIPVSFVMKIYEDKEQNVFGEENFREVERVVLLRNVDQKWMDHLEAMDDMRSYVGLNSYAQRDPVSVYRFEGEEMFNQMVTEIRESTTRMLLSVMPKAEPIRRVQVIKPLIEGFANGKIPKKAASTAAGSKKVGRNDPCPCGSGKKYKKCCGRTSADKGEE